MGQVFGEKAAIGDESRIDGHPIFVIFRFENGPDHGGGEGGNQEQVQGTGFAFGQKEGSSKVGLTAIFYSSWLDL